jgi:TonB family protein
MSYPDRISLQEREIGSLDDLLRLAQSRRYEEAQGTVRTAREGNPRNIFLIALEKQIERLASLTGEDAPSAQQRSEILDTLPSLITNARTTHNEKASPSIPAPEDRRDARVIALEKLKNQYFHHADEDLRRGDYEQALVEIRRVQILDPGNKMAEEYDRKLRELSGAVQPQVPSEPPEASAVVPTAPILHSNEAPPREEPAPADRRTSKRKSMTIVLVSVASLLALIVAALFFFVPAQPVQLPAQAQQQGSTPPQETMTTPALQPAAEQDPPQTVAAIESPAPEVVPPVVKQKTPPESDQARKTIPPASVAVQSTQPVPEPKPAKEPETVMPAKLEGSSSLQVKTDQSSVTVTQVAMTERMPEIVKLEQPRIPSPLMGSGAGGEVIVKVQVNTEGKPVQAKIVKSTNSLLNDAVVEAVMKSEYTPGTMASGPVTTWISIPFRFTR